MATAREAKIKHDRVKQEYQIRRKDYLSQGLVKQVIQKDSANVKWAKVELANKRAKLEEFDYNRYIPKARREIDLLDSQGRFGKKVASDINVDKQATLLNDEYETYERIRQHLTLEIKVAQRELRDMTKLYEETKKYLDPEAKQRLDKLDRAQAAIEAAMEDVLENKPGAYERLAAARALAK